MNTLAWVEWAPGGITFGYSDEPVPMLCARPGCSTLLPIDALGDLCPTHYRYGGNA